MQEMTPKRIALMLALVFGVTTVGTLTGSLLSGCVSSPTPPGPGPAPLPPEPPGPTPEPALVEGLRAAMLADADPEKRANAAKLADVYDATASKLESGQLSPETWLELFRLLRQAVLAVLRDLLLRDVRQAVATHLDRKLPVGERSRSKMTAEDRQKAAGEFRRVAAALREVSR